MPFRAPLFAVAAVLGLLAAGGCSGLKVLSDYDPGVDFAAVKTYAWHVDPTPNPPGAPMADDLLMQRVVRAVDDRLAAKGLRLVSRQDADVLVTYYVSIEQKLRVDTFDYGYGYGWYGGYGRGTAGVYRDTRVEQYEEGTLLLDLIDPESMQLIWRGSATGRIRNDSTPEQREQRVREAVDAILARFPPGG